ncbi:hypothetical protein DFH06DRAFT_1305581 [Mycena polygramma]|nr:hypothetical protein DFH06DRAFT_1305581 [Mycena polygramma]
MADVQAHTARLISLFVGCILYDSLNPVLGILLTTFVRCLRSLIFSTSQRVQFKSRREVKFPILAATVLMFLVSTFSAVLSMQNVLDGFINYDGPGGALGYYATYRGWTQWMPAVEDSVQVTLGDGLLIYRCYVLHDRDWRAVAVPTAVWTSLIVTSITSTYRESILPEGTSLNDPSVEPFIAATLLLTFLTSIITTCLIIRRLLRIEHHLCSTIRPHLLSRIAAVFFETGLIYTISVVVSLVLYLTGNALEYVASLAIIHIVPITCNLLLIRVEGVNRLESPIVDRGTELEYEEDRFNPKGADQV